VTAVAQEPECEAHGLGIDEEVREEHDEAAPPLS
jgi:hypothetical protein